MWTFKRFDKVVLPETAEIVKDIETGWVCIVKFSDGVVLAADKSTLFETELFCYFALFEYLKPALLEIKSKYVAMVDPLRHTETQIVSLSQQRSGTDECKDSSEDIA